ncbi:TetR/AcrR family transcriptional regulator [Roseovarius sp. SCSIO 43702]|uniref:TetR/AcrR family transcriptional regulator n=1 Tax=Roseovarius sp. SCSIO 43702 TaxID=2823043 RepID=UPI001C73944A|nr:TetR/AcrR family transcriptional regulator [Roseovarius sp. SCSIO 43702]QYX57509.1 TetR/AcrR family transcriptional regulator [Roseovarius sp. SCSIO 43702]
MARKTTDRTAERREALRDTLIDVAEARIAAEGMDAVKARALAREAGCAVGAIYNVFDDISDVIIAVNGRTFQRLGQAVAASLENTEGKGPTERLIIMANAYLDFAAAHPNRWRTLFDLRMSTDMAVPQWYLNELERLFGFIAGPVRECFPDLDAEEVELMTRALFSSVHGIVLLGLERRISAVPPDHLRRMIGMLLTQATAK